MRDIARILRLVLPWWRNVAGNIAANVLSALFSVLSIAMVVPFLRILFGSERVTEAPSALAMNKESISAWFNYSFSQLIFTYGEQATLVLLCAGVVLAFFFKNLFYYLALWFLAPARAGVVRELRAKLYSHLLILPLSFYSRRKKGDLLARTTSDVQEVEWSILQGFELFFREPVSLVFFLVTLWLISLELSLFVFILLPLAGLIIGRIGRSLRRRSGKAQNLMGQLLSTVEESIAGLRIIKAFNAIPYSIGRFKTLNRSYTRLLIGITRRSDLSAPLSEFLGVIILVGILWFGGRMVLSESVDLGPEVFITYLVIFSQMINPAKNLTTAWYQVQKGSASLDRIGEVLAEQEVITEKPGALPIRDLGEGIRFSGLSFSYGDEPVLQDIDLDIGKGQVVALVGPSGAGKSTLADLLPRFHDRSGGQLLIDGRPIEDYRIDEVRALMGIVSQDTILFNDSVHNNIAFGGSYSREEVSRAARIANAEEFILLMEEGYDTVIGDRGVRLSGGQRQRISIARAVLRNPPLLILDEATSALDTVSERLVQEAIDRILGDRTVVVIAHRLSTIRHADLIVVLEQG
ncbi:MAG TPA: ABC transporter ATP-binding protein, partial [Bacteroidales bacterium]|nr:ABC transporter ATP-binding protein [Bacteroidales bacterium]